jgi:hypothetical protein
MDRQWWKWGPHDELMAQQWRVLVVARAQARRCNWKMKRILSMTDLLKCNRAATLLEHTAQHATQTTGTPSERHISIQFGTREANGGCC